MALVKLSEFDSRYAEKLGDQKIVHYGVYADADDEKVGSVDDILIDEATGTFRYLIIDIGIWILGKQILLPIDRAQIDFAKQRVYARGLTKEQAEHLPKFDQSLKIDDDYDRQVSDIYPPRSLNSLDAETGTGSAIDPASPVVPFGPLTMGNLAALNRD